MYSMHTVRVTVTFMDTLIEGSRERVTVGVQYMYFQSYCDFHGYSDRKRARERM